MPSSRVDLLLERLSSSSETPSGLDQAASGPVPGDVRCASIMVTGRFVVERLEMRPDESLVCAFTGVEVSPAPDPGDAGAW